MNTNNFIAQVKMMYPHLTKAEKKVADYVLENPKECLYMSITDLAAECRVGETTVFRFCKSMKLQGYQEFRIQLSLCVQDGEEKKDREMLNGNIGMDDSFPVMIQKLLNSNINVLTETHAILDEEKIKILLEKMIAAKRIFFFGMGASQVMAMMAMNKFLRISNKVYCFTDSHIQTMMASTLQKDDVAIVISYSGSTKDSVLIAKLAKQNQAYVAGLTRFQKSPLVDYTDIVLLCGANEGPLQGGSTTAVMSQMLIIEVLYIEYYRRTFDGSYENNQKTSQSITNKMY